jgi:hypothetical protein
MKTLISLITITLFSLSAFAQANSDAPIFEFEETTHDFGNVKEGPDATFDFKFKNVGKTPLIIQNCSASCGCTTPNWSRDPIMPGKTGVISVKYSTKGRIGTINKTVYIKSNAQSLTERFELYIKGSVIPESKIVPGVKMNPSKQ